MSRTNKGMDPIHIAQATYDADLEATRVSMLPMEMAIEVSANDGDSVLSIPKMEVIEVEANEVIDCSQAKRMSVSANCDLTLVVGETEIAGGALTAGQVKEICIPEIKVSQACKVILQS